MDESDWQQQLEEVVALQAILGPEDFRLISAPGHPPSSATGPSDPSSDDGAQDSETLDPEALLAAGPPQAVPGGELPAPLTCQAMVHVEVPPGGLQLKVAMGGQGSSGSSPEEDGTEGGGDAIDFGQPVSALPPLRLDLVLPLAYPSHQPPSLKLFALWLAPRQAVALESELLAQWTAQGPGTPIIYAWLDWLKTEGLGHLGVGQVLLLSHTMEAPDAAPTSQQPATAAGAAGASSSRGPRPGAPPAVPPDQVALCLLRYHAQHEWEEFQRATWRCPICFDDVPGSACLHLPECRDVFCRACLGQHCRTQLEQGAVDNMKCPQPGCKRGLPPYVLGDLLSEAEFARWESLLLQRTLDRMSDVVYCPRCHATVIEDQDHMGQCPQCLFVFCSLCSESWHPGSVCLDPETKLALLQARGQGADARLTLEERRARERRMAEDLLSLKVVKATTRPCPTCGMGISKTEGCNKMVCQACGNPFCFKCGQDLSHMAHPYQHFGSESCNLLDQDEVDRWNRQMNQMPFLPIRGVAYDRRDQVALDQEVQAMRRLQLQAEGRGAGRVGVCPACGQHNLKEGNNNHMRCWSCSAHFCYLCRMWLRTKPGLHFGPKGCKQHTVD